MTTTNRRHAAGLILAGIAAGMLAACGGANVKDPIPPVPYVDVPRFMGDWYVIAQIPTRLEREAYDSVETYTLRDDDGKSYGEIARLVEMPKSTVRDICTGRRRCQYPADFKTVRVPDGQ